MNTFLSAMIFHLEASAPSSLETSSVSCSKLLSCHRLLLVTNRYLPCRSTKLWYNPFTVNQYVPYIYDYMRVIASMAGSSDTVKSQRTATEVSGGDNYNYWIRKRKPCSPGHLSRMRRTCSHFPPKTKQWNIQCDYHIS
jgi:hypothetical protein